MDVYPPILTQEACSPQWENVVKVRKSKKRKKGKNLDRCSLRKYLDVDFKILAKFVRYGYQQGTALFVNITDAEGGQKTGAFICDHVWLSVKDADPEFKPNARYVFNVQAMEYHKGYTLCRMDETVEERRKPQPHLNSRQFKQRKALKNRYRPLPRTA